MHDTPRILLVEDNPYDLELSLISLRRSNLANEIDIVRDGEEALDYLYHRGKYQETGYADPCLILLDVRLPKIDGMEVLGHIRADAKLAEIPVVVMTGSPHEQDALERYQLGIKVFLEKPIDLSKFHRALRDAGMYWFMSNQNLASSFGWRG